MSVTPIIIHLGDFQPVRVAAYQVYITECTHKFIAPKKGFVLFSEATVMVAHLQQKTKERRNEKSKRKKQKQCIGVGPCEKRKYVNENINISTVHSWKIITKNKDSPTVAHGRQVMVVLKQNQFFFTKDNKQSISKLKQFAHVEQKDPPVADVRRF